MKKYLTDEQRIAKAKRLSIRGWLLGFRKIEGKNENEVFIRLPWWLPESATAVIAKNLQKDLRLMKSRIEVLADGKLMRLFLLDIETKQQPLSANGFPVCPNGHELHPGQTCECGWKYEIVAVHGNTRTSKVPIVYPPEGVRITDVMRARMEETLAQMTVDLAEQ